MRCIQSQQNYTKERIENHDSSRSSHTISINIRQTRILTTLGYSVAPAAWEEYDQVIVRYTNSKGIPSRKINNRIMKIKLHFSEYENDLKVRLTLHKIIAFPDIDAYHDWLLKYLEDHNS